MATRTKAPAADEPEVVGKILLLPVADIEIGKRLRSLDRVWAAALGNVMAREGQRTPIEVCRLPGRTGWTLVAGAHRLVGARLVEMVTLKAIVVEGDPRERIAREVSENLMRLNLDPIDRAAFIAEQVALLRERAGLEPGQDGRVVSARIRWQKELQNDANDAEENFSNAYGWDEEVGRRLGLTGRTIRNDLLLHKRISPALVAMLRDYESDEGVPGHPVLENASQLRTLAKLDEHEQHRVVTALIDGSAATIAEALGAKRGNRNPQPEDKHLSAFLGAWSRMSLTEKKGALGQLCQMLPAGYRIEEGPPRTAKNFPAEHVEHREAAMSYLDEAREVIDGLIEDEIIVGERAEALNFAARHLGYVRTSIAAHDFELGGEA